MHTIHTLPGLIAAARFINSATELTIGHELFDFVGETSISPVVPAGMNRLLLDLWGGSGSVGASGGFRGSGGGGWTHLVIDVQEGDVVEIYTGEGGGTSVANVEGGEGGWPDGGNGSRAGSIVGGGGGGSSRVYVNGTLVAIAGGGAGENGSSGTQGSGGSGGGSAPEIHSGTDDLTMTPASQTAAGTNTVDANASGAAFQGGHAHGSSDRFTALGGTAGGGGGGGGLFGGAGYHGRGGGGGSGWSMPVGGDSNSLLDREVYESTTLNGVDTDGQGRQAQGWDRWKGSGVEEGTAATGGDILNSHNGRVSVWGFAPGGDAPLGRLPINVTAELSQALGSANRMEFRQYICPTDMVIDEVGFFTTNTLDSNSAVASSVPVSGGRVFLYNDAGLANSAGALLGRSANITTINDGENWFALNQTYYARRGEILWVGYNFGTAITISLDRIALASGQSRRAASITVATNPTPEQLWGITNSVRTEAYPVAARGFVPTTDPTDDVVVAVVPFTNPTSAGSIDVTDDLLGSRVPKGVVIVGGYAPPNTANTGSINVGTGVASRASENQWCMSANLTDNVSLSDGRTDQRAGSIISRMTPGTSVGGGGQTMRATVSAWIAGGVTINFTVAEATQRQFFAIFFAGDDLDCVATRKEDWPSGVTPQDRFGFPPDFLIWTGEFSNGGNGDGDQLSSGYAFGMGIAQGSEQGCIWQRQSDIQSAASNNPAGGASNTRVEKIQNITATTFIGDLTAQGYDADGFEINASAALSSTDSHYLAVRTRGGMSVEFIDFTTPTSTGVQNVTGAGFQPKAALLLGHSAVAWDTGYYNDADASGFGIAAFDTNGGVCLSFYNSSGPDSNSALTDCASSAHDNEFNIGRGNSAETLNAEWDGFTSDGFDLDWQAVHTSACRGLALVFGW